MKDIAAIILCAGKGSRMNDDSKSKVCFDCAGEPVIRRIIENMKSAGVTRFVVVIGHQAYSVMDCLDGVDGVVYAYQKEQKGTGHATLCGLKALSAIGHTGPTIVSMGDKIVSPKALKGILERAQSAKAVWGVQPVAANKGGGRVVVRDGKPLGIVEFVDAALMKLADVTPDQYAQTLKDIGLNPKKAEKVLKLAKKENPVATRTLCGQTLTADDVLSTPYANAALYCFDIQAVIEAIGTLRTNNAQGELYITDTLEYFAKTDDVALYEVADYGDLLTYSTKRELCTVSEYFMRTVSQYQAAITAGEMDAQFSRLYGDDIAQQKQRYLTLLEKFAEKYGDRKVVITRAPGRVNLMGRHIDHRGGGINVMATDCDQVFVAARREDNTVCISNVDAAYPDRSFSIADTLAVGNTETWLQYLNDENVKQALKENRGDWANYVKASVLRAQLHVDHPLSGMDLMASGNIPVAAGLSSSSALVVAVMEAVEALNCLNLSEKEFVDLCGEGEWFVGSRGGAGDHAAMKCGQQNTIVHIDFKPFKVGKRLPFSDEYAILVANSMLQAKKSEGSRDVFNEKVACYEFALMLLQRAYPQYELKEFRDLAKIRPYSKVYEMLRSLPETITRGGIKALLPAHKQQLETVFATHKEPLVYELRSVALFGISECARAEKFVQLLEDGDYEAIGHMMKRSHDGDRLGVPATTDELLDELIAQNTPFELQSGAYRCSTVEIDGLCDLLNSTDGVLGSQLAGAGLGGCVVALIRKNAAQKVIDAVNKGYYDHYGYPHCAAVYSASCGSSVIF